MKLVKIEPTPSPNNMKLVVSELLPLSESHAYTLEKSKEAPPFLQKILNVEGVKSLYRVADFISLERVPQVEWEDLLPKVRAIFSNQEETIAETDKQEGTPDAAYGEVRVFTQMLFDIPMQAKLEVNGEEIRVGLPEKFINAVMQAQKAATNLIFERKWVENYPRYGEVETIRADVLDELSAAYDEERLNDLVDRALHPEKHKVASAFKKVKLEDMEDPDWKNRYAALDRLNPSAEDIPVLIKALEDEKVAIRRLAVVYLGMLEDSDVLPLLFKSLKDRTVTVRRTAGDVLSDLGDPKAIPAMIEALNDPSKIVRWRAAMFLYEVGDETALPALKEKKDDSEFEVALQIQMAIERIEGGEEAKGSVWKQMTEFREKNK